MKNVSPFLTATLTIAITLCGCGEKEVAKPEIYTGPLSEAREVEMFYTEKDLIKSKMTASRVLEFQSGDREFPDGIYLEFYDETGAITSTLRANHAYYFKKDLQWRGRGNVEIKNIGKNEQLDTEELFWRPDTKRIFTDKFVTIRQQGDIIYGTGLDAAQDLSDYKIMKPTGDFEVRENE